jgi:hypothetical protein
MYFDKYKNASYLSLYHGINITDSDRGLPKINWKLLYKNVGCFTNVSELLKKGFPDSDTVHSNAICLRSTHKNTSVSDFRYESECNNIDELKNDSSPMNTPIKQQDENLFWEIISGIRCLDKDEGTMTNRSIKLSPIMKKHVIKMLIRKYFDELSHAITDVALPFDDEKNRHNFMTHIITKGKVFYDGILNVPSVCLYLCDNYYPIYDWIIA